MGEYSVCLAPGKVGEIWTIPHFEQSGLVSTVYSDPQKTEVVHYVRQETKDLWDKLEECRTSEFEQFALLCVYGDPGSGKSTTLWGYTQCVGSTSSVAWVTQGDLRYLLAWSATEHAPTHEVFQFSDYKQMVAAIILHNPALVVLNEIVVNPMAICSLKWMLGYFMEAMKHKCMFVISTSLQFIDYYGAYLRCVSQDIWFVCGWTVEDIWAARKAALRTGLQVLPAPLLNKTDDTAFRKQLHIAGGNMRFMMENCALVQEELRGLIPADNWKDLWTAAIGRLDKYNRLFIHTNRGKTKHFVSDFIYQEVSRQVSIKELDYAATVVPATIVPANKAFMRIIFQIRVRQVFKNAVAERKRVTFTKTKFWSLPETFRIEKIVDYSEAQSGGPGHLEYTTHCHIPVKWNQDCFDFVLLRRENTGTYHVYFLQLTVVNHQDALL